jgi:hypothetical protein
VEVQKLATPQITHCRGPLAPHRDIVVKTRAQVKANNILMPINRAKANIHCLGQEQAPVFVITASLQQVHKGTFIAYIKPLLPLLASSLVSLFVHVWLFVNWD